jgi:hypothetical protein
MPGRRRGASGCLQATVASCGVRSFRALPPFWYWCALVRTEKVRSGHGQAQKKQCLVAAIARRAECVSNREAALSISVSKHVLCRICGRTVRMLHMSYHCTDGRWVGRQPPMIPECPFESFNHPWQRGNVDIHPAIQAFVDIFSSVESTNIVFGPYVPDNNFR